MILYFNPVASLKIWVMSDVKVLLGNHTTQNLPDKSQNISVTLKTRKALMCTIICTVTQVREYFWKILFKFIHSYILLENIK